MANILAADIGGTNSRFGCFFTDHSGGLILQETRWFKTKEVESFRDLIGLLRRSGFSLLPEHADIVIIAAAGPVEDGVSCDPPLISWGIDLSDAKREFGFQRSLLINDFVAQAYACCSSVRASSRELLPGTPLEGAVMGVIGAGTGLGKAAVVPDSTGRYLVLPSEGCHADYPFVLKNEFRFKEFLMREFSEEYISANMVVSGRGIQSLHHFLSGESLAEEEVLSGLLSFPETLSWAARFYGRACRNFALEILARGGMYIAGGITAKVPELVTHDSFRREFHHSSALGHILKRIPVFLIGDEESGLWGGASYAARVLQQKSG